MAIPEVRGMRQVIIQAENNSILPPIPIVTDVRNNNDIRLSKNMKLRIAHKGITETPHSYQSGRISEVVVVTPDIIALYPDALDNTWLGRTISISIAPAIEPMPLASSTTGDTDLIEPAAVLAEDEQEVIVEIRNLPGKVGGPVMDSDNYLTLSSHQQNGIYVPEGLEQAPSSSSSI